MFTDPTHLVTECGSAEESDSNGTKTSTTKTNEIIEIEPLLAGVHDFDINV